MQRLPGLVERASSDRVYVQLVHMGFSHRLWLPRERVSHGSSSPVMTNDNPGVDLNDKGGLGYSYEAAEDPGRDQVLA